MKKRWIVVGVFAVLAAGALGLAAMQGPEQQAEMNEIYAETNKLDATIDHPAPDQNAPAPKPDDTVRYDPENARKSQLADIVEVDTDRCIDQYIRYDLNNGIKSRAAIVAQITPLCGREYLNGGLMSQQEEENFVRAKTEGEIDVVAREGQ